MQHATRYLLAAWLLAFLTVVGLSSAHAAYTRASGGAFKGSGSSWTYTGGGNMASGTASTISTVNVGGTYVPIPTSAQVLSGAAQVATSAIRLNPAGLIVGSVAAWLMQEGIQYLDGQFSKSQTSTYPSTYRWNSNAPSLTGQTWATSTEAGTAVAASIGKSFYGFTNCRGTGENYLCDVAYSHTGSPYCPTGVTCGVNSGISVGRFLHCATGGTLSADRLTCTTTNPAGVPTEADWDNLEARGIPDAVVQDLAPQVPMPVAPPTTQPVSVPTSGPKWNPVEKHYYREYVRVEPAPTATDPMRVDVRVTVQVTDQAGEPVLDPQGQTQEQKPDDPCLLNPESLACAKLDTPEAPATEQNERALSINPLSGFGADNATCPAPQVVQFMHQPVAIEWTIPCQFATGIRPVVLAVAWLAAAMITFNIMRRA